MTMPAPAASSDSSGIGAALLDAEDRNQRRAEWRIVRTIAGVSAAVSFLFGVVMASDPELDDRLLSGLQGIVNSLMVSVPVIWIEVAGSRSHLMRRIRNWPFWAYLLVKTAAYIILIVGSVQLCRLLFDPVNPQSMAFDRRFFEIVAFAGGMSIAINVIVEIGRLVGFREMRRVLTGRYLQPRQERRVFLMVDMKDSTAAAERLGDLHFHQLLNGFFRSVADAAYDHGAEIHKYIGDEAILTWPEETALRGARCALCPFGIGRRLERTASEFRQRFGFVPGFRAVLHAGEIVAGEMGAMKREIAFVGDTLNTAARLMDVARERGLDVVISGELAARLSLPAGLALQPLDPAHLRGKEKPLPVAALRLA